ncbi:MAG: hypothetical protein EOO68_27945 [Moraxellaceae bacterium]|nr:MAG: hypothetical protein EOO68_27945 [Moraxellaceae bacterium]
MSGASLLLARESIFGNLLNMNIRPTKRLISAPLALCSIFTLLVGCGGSSNGVSYSSSGATGVIMRSATSVAAIEGEAQSSAAVEQSSVTIISEVQTSSAPSIISEKDTVSPTAPEAIRKVSSTTSEIELAWTEASDDIAVALYKVYRNKALIATLDASTLSYRDENVKPNSLYTYSVVAADSAGNISDLKSLLAQTPAEESSSSAAQIIVDENLSSIPFTSSKSSSFKAQVSSKINSSSPVSSIKAVSSAQSSSINKSTASSTASSKNAVSKSAVSKSANSQSPASTSVMSKSSTASSKKSADTEAPVITSSILKKALTETSVSLTWGAAIDNVGVTGYKIYKDQKLVATLDANQLS